MSVPALRVFPGTYRDSLLLLSATRAMQEAPGVDWATAVMATPAAVEDLTAEDLGRALIVGARENVDRRLRSAHA